MTPEIEYGNNLIRNPSAESNLTHWTSNGVTVKAGGVAGAKCFRLSSDATLRQSEEYLAFVVAPATFKVKIHHKHTAAQGTLYANIRSFCTLRITYEDSTVPNSTYILPLNSQGTVGKWLTSEMECDIQIDSIVKGYTLVVNNVGGDADLQIDSIELRSGVDGLSAHNATEHPHNLPLAIGVGSYGIKATKGDEIQFWLTDEGDAIFKGEISAAQITVGKILDSQIDVEGLDLLRNPTFSSISSNMSTLDGVVGGQATAIQQNASAISLQATSISTIDGKTNTNAAAINVNASNISLKVTSDDVKNMLNVNTSGVQIHANNIDLTGITTMYSPTRPASDYFRYFGNGVVLYENGIERMSITATDASKVELDCASLYLKGRISFSEVTVHGLALKFA